MERRITLRDVAGKTGLSTAAVSMALRNSPRLPLSTRTRVQKVARAMGYQYDPMLAALAAHRWKRSPSRRATLAILADGAVEGHGGMVERAATYGYNLEVFQIRDYPDPKRLADVLYHRGIVGVIVAQIFKPGFCAAFDWSRFISVACSEGYERPPVHLVMPNHFGAVQEAWDRAWEAGHRRIGMVLYHMPMAIDYHERCAAFMEKQRQVNESQRIPPCTIVPKTNDPLNLDKNRDILGDWMKQWKPDAVLGFNDAFYWGLRGAGWMSPKAYQFYDLWLTELPTSNPGLYLPYAEVGRRTVEYLDALIRSGERGLPDFPATVSISFTWRNGRSVRGARRK